MHCFSPGMEAGASASIFTKKIFHMIRLVPYLSNLLTAAFLFLAALLFAFCLQTWIPVLKKKPYDKGLLLAAAFFVTAPSLCRTVCLYAPGFEITLSMCICMIAVYCAGRAVYGNGSGDLVSGSGAASGMDIRLLSGVLRLLYGTGADLISGKL